MTLTAFVSHPDCARHDTGWKHPDHQGRLPALVRAVYRDMLTLHGHLLDVEARAATEEDLLRVHTPRHLRAVRESVARADAVGGPVAMREAVMVSSATWDAVRAAAGTALSGVDEVLQERARNAFCAARPPGNTARAGGADGYALVNNVAVAARYIQRKCGVQRVLIVEWGAQRGHGTIDIFAGDPSVRIVSVHQQPSGSEPELPRTIQSVSLPPGTSGGLYLSAFEAALSESVRDFAPEFILLSAGFDALSDDPIGALRLEPGDYYALTAHLGARADEVCHGRLVSVLEGGYAPQALGAAVVQHLRALADLPPM